MVARLVFASCNFDKWQVRCQKCCELFVCSSAPIASREHVADPSLPETWIADGNPPPPLIPRCSRIKHFAIRAHTARGRRGGGGDIKRETPPHTHTNTHMLQERRRRRQLCRSIQRKERGAPFSAEAEDDNICGGGGGRQDEKVR